MTWLLGLLGGVLGLLGPLGAGPPDPPPSPPPTPATLVDSWSQADHEGLGRVDVDEQVIWDDAARDALLDVLPRGVETTAVEAVDLETHVLVAGGYHRCTESSLVVLSADGVDLEVTDGEPGVACGWSPYTVDVWAVPRSALGSEQPPTAP